MSVFLDTVSVDNDARGEWVRYSDVQDMVIEAMNHNQEAGSCPKCGGTHTITMFVPIGVIYLVDKARGFEPHHPEDLSEDGTSVEATSAHILHSCPCGWKWVSACKDTPAVVEVDPLVEAPYILAVTSALLEQGASVVPSPASLLGVTIPMFDIIARPLPFKPNEGLALAEVIKCAKKYYQKVLDQLGVPTGSVVVGPSNQGQKFGTAVAVGIGFYAEDASRICYVGLEGGDIVVVPKPQPLGDQSLFVLVSGVDCEDCQDIIDSAWSRPDALVKAVLWMQKTWGRDGIARDGGLTWDSPIHHDTSYLKLTSIQVPPCK